jgi:hypothetical protein
MLLRAFAAILVAGVAACAHPFAKPLNCGVAEALALKMAPLGAARVSTHELRVRWRGGTRVFRDSGGVPGDMGGIDYRYCGYDPASGFHLIFKHDDAIFGGVLLNHASGRELPGGQQVLFAPDTTRYFATVQPDGLDGEEWDIYSTRRGQLWQGVSSIRAQDSSRTFEYAIAELSHPHWSVTGELQATLTCTGKPHSEIVTLHRQPSGFAWLPTVPCPRTQ